jgi:hypothetical protein
MEKLRAQRALKREAEGEPAHSQRCTLCGEEGHNKRTCPKNAESHRSHAETEAVNALVEEVASE